MTGISVGKGRPPKDQCPAERWSELKQAPERYSIIQLGVALFHVADDNNGSSSVGATASPNNGGNGRGYAVVSPVAAHAASASAPHYHVRRYNFYMFPDASSTEREVVLNPSTVAFLNQHNMSFDVWSKQGVPFASNFAEAEEILSRYVILELADRDRNGPGSALLLRLQQQQQPTIQGAIRRRVELRRPEDIDFFARAMAGLREWLDSDNNHAAAGAAQARPNDNDDEEEEEGAVGDGAAAVAVAAPEVGEGLSFLLPPCNSFLRRALYENIEQEYPALELESAGNSQIRVWRLNEEEKRARQQRLRRERWEATIGRKVGMWRVFQALHLACSGQEIDRNSVLFAESYDQVDWSSSTTSITTGTSVSSVPRPQCMIPLIVHNGFMDICFLLSHFHSSKLPDSYQECKDLISKYWPIIYDTKVISTECNCWGNNNNDLNAQNTNLANLFRNVVQDGSPPSNEQRMLYMDQLQVIESVGNMRGGAASVQDQEHEAAYDAYMTGSVFLGLCMLIRQVGTVSPDFLDVVSRIDSREAKMFYGRNKLYQLSMYTMDLEETEPNRDPMSRGMLPETTYRVTGFDKAVNTRGKCCGSIVVLE